MKRKFLAGLLSLCMIFSLVPMTAFAAEVTVNSAADLQTALNEATDGAIIVFGADITGSVKLEQKPDVKITIDGAGKTMKGSININGKSATYVTAGVTIKNVNFDATDVANITADACINLGSKTNINNERYVCNVTVENCTFTGGGRTVPAVKSYTGGDKNLTVKGCTVDNTMHSLLQADNITGVLVEGCTVNSKNGINLNSSSDVAIKESTISVSGYAMRAGASSGGESGEIVLTNNTLKTAGDDGDAAIIIRGTAANQIDLTMRNNSVSGDKHFSGTTGETKIDAEENHWADKNGTTETKPDTNGTAVKVDKCFMDANCTQPALNDEIVAKIVVNEVEKYYRDFATAFTEANGAAVIMVKDIAGAVSITANATLDLNGKTLTGSIAVPANVTATVQNGTIINTDGSKSAVESVGNEITLKDVKIDSARHAVRVEAGNLVIWNGEYTVTPIADTTVTIHAINLGTPSGSNVTATINGGTFTGLKGKPTTGTDDSGAALNIQATATVIVNDGAFTGCKNDTISEAVADSVILNGGTYDQDPTAYLGAKVHVCESNAVFTVHGTEYRPEVPATCTSTGTEDYYVCAAGKMFEDEEATDEISSAVIIPITEHPFCGWYTVKEPNCFNAGYEARMCACGATESRSLAATSHNYDVNGVCAICGLTKEVIATGTAPSRTNPNTGVHF